MTAKPFLETERILLRPLTSDDVEGPYILWLNDPEICAHNSHHVFPYTKAQGMDYVNGPARDPKNLVLAIVAKDSGAHIGNIALQGIDTVSRNAEYAILLGDRAYWGKGIASEASRLLIGHGFSALNLHRIYCGTSAKNEAMRKLATSLGMQEEGVRREAHYKNGEYADIIEYGILETEWTHE